MVDSPRMTMRHHQQDACCFQVVNRHLNVCTSEWQTDWVKKLFPCEQACVCIGISYHKSCHWSQTFNRKRPFWPLPFNILRVECNFNTQSVSWSTDRSSLPCGCSLSHAALRRGLGALTGCRVYIRQHSYTTRSLTRTHIVSLFKARVPWVHFMIGTHTALL